MTLRSFVRVAITCAAAIVCAAFVGCSSDPPAAPAELCDLAKSSLSRCNTPATCDAHLATTCATLGKVVSEAAVTSTRDCLESGVCGVASCLARAPKSATPTQAHKSLATAFCTYCTTNVLGCEAEFYARGAKRPGRLVLPYSPEVAAAVEAECVGTPTCQATFAACASEVSARIAGDTFDGSAADCVVQALKGEEEGKTGPGGAQVATCTRANCNGCCRDDKCEEGATVNACGKAGGGCQVCSGQQTCTSGECQDPCGPGNCPGCCDGTTCVVGSTKEACGGGGGACKACAGDLICSNKTCIDGSCRANCASGCCSATGCQPGTAPTACGGGGEACIDCGFGRECRAGTGICVIDPNGLWDVYISQATLPDKDNASAPWDVLAGAPDPYLNVFTSLGTSTHSGVTKTLTDTRLPLWAETPLVGVKAGELLSNFAIEIWDEDFDFDDFMGGCTVPLLPAIFDGSLQSHVCPKTASGVEVTFYFRLKPHAP